MSKWQIYHPTYTPTQDNSTTFSYFSPYLGGGIVGNLMSALLLFRLTGGLGLGVGLVGSSPGFRPCLRAGGIGDQGTTLTHDPILTRPTLDALGNPY
jgi:hypothetical protein